MTQNITKHGKELGPAGFQLGITDLFFLTAFVAGLALVYSRAWTIGIWFAMAVIVSIGVGYIFIRGSSTKNKLLNGFSLTAAIVMAVFALFTGATSILFVVVAHFVGFSCLCFGKHWPGSLRSRLRMSMVCIVVGLLVWTGFTPDHITSLVGARARFPIEDLSDRLVYETAGPRARSTESERRLKLADPVESRLANLESSQPLISHFSRVSRLERIHDEQYERFVRSMGFGVGRMVPIRPSSLAAPQPPVIKFTDELPSEEEYGIDGPGWSRILDYEPTVAHGNLQDYHDVGETDFLHPATFGFVRSSKNAAGFLPHAFHFPVGRFAPGEFESLSLEKLQLISLLRFEKPRAYVLDHLPRMDHLSSGDIPTRELTQFEINGLNQLRSDEDIVVSETGTGLQMLGSLRAGTTCLDCHSVERGELLGAFTYQFGRNRH